MMHLLSGENFSSDPWGKRFNIELLYLQALPSGCAIVAGLASGLVKVLVVRLKEKLEDLEANRMTFDDSNEAKWLHCIQVSHAFYF